MFSWNGLSRTDKCLRVIILSLIMYIIVYYFINSEYCNANSVISENKQYIYFIAIIDLILYICSHLLVGDSANKAYNKKKRIKGRNNKSIENPLNIPNISNIPNPYNPTNHLKDGNNLSLSNQNMDNDTLDMPIYKGSAETN